MIARCKRCDFDTLEIENNLCLICDAPHIPMDIHLWFNLTYANYLVIPRLWLQTMPLDWQYKFVKLLNEIPETLEIDPEYTAEYIVTCKRRGKFIKDIYRNYRHGTIKRKEKTDRLDENIHAPTKPTE